ncbi:MAG: hypothetical protein GEU77_06085 [Deltaproteobacteria bacterium]|nr:hypothetical protein [Deltaproteobacteria bacterium]
MNEVSRDKANDAKGILVPIVAGRSLDLGNMKKDLLGHQQDCFSDDCKQPEITNNQVSVTINRLVGQFVQQKAKVVFRPQRRSE